MPGGEQARKTLEAGVDVVRVAVDRAEKEHVFPVAAGLGYDASIMDNIVEGLKDRVGRLAYVESGVRNLPGKPVTASIPVAGNHQHHRKVRGVMVGNCGRLMGGVEIFPNAKVADGIVDLLTLALRMRAPLPS